MFGLSCFQGHMDSHKHKKTVNLPGETMHATPENPSRSRVLGNFSNSVTEKLPCPNEEEDSPYNADHVTDSSPTERECRSEELENNINLEVHNDAPIRKSQSLGGGLNWVERTSDADGSDQKISSDESADKRDMELNNSGLGLHDQFLEPVPSDSIRVNSDCEKYMSIFSIGDPLQYEEEHTHHQDDLCLSGAVKSNDCTPRAQPPISKSNSLPNMTSVIRRSPSFTRCSRSVEDLNSLEFGKKKNVSHRHERELQYQERFDTIIDDDDQNHEENLADDTYDEYVGLSKDWIVPASDGANGEKGINGEASLKHSLDEVPPKDFRLKRIENWVTDLQHYSPLEISEELNPVYHNESSKGKAVMEEPTVINTEMKISPGTEAAKNYISSLNASATAAQLTNLGLVTIPFFSAFVSIKALNLSGNSIVRITAGALPRGLHILNLSRNSISTIEGLRELTRLRVLDLSYNRIVRIGHGLSSCSSLKELYLAGNKISEVEGLHRLLKLNVLDLRFNKISTTKCLGQLAANYNCLQALSLEGNPASKNVGDEPLKKYVQSLLPHLTYYNRQPIKTGTAMKDSSSDRSARLGICAHQIDRGLKKGTHGVVAQKVPSSSSSSVHGRKGHLASHKSSRGSRHGTRPHPPSGMRLSAAAEVGGKVITGLRNDFLIQRSHSEGYLGAV